MGRLFTSRATSDTWLVQLSFDTIKRHLVYSGWEVTWVVNITDVDDKLIAESKTVRNMSMTALAEEMTADYLDNLSALGVQWH